jgi:antitoxin (DNA-binding transcriptional repressor) of toxin-antitoxin stability system
LETQGGTITVTERVRPVATVQPAKKTRYKSPKGSLVGKIEIVGDIANEDTSHLERSPRGHRIERRATAVFFWTLTLSFGG